METLADHAESWQRDIRGRAVPPRGTGEWDSMYSEWHEYAFADFGKERPVTKPTYVVRKNGLAEVYLQKDGTFGPYKTARIFKSQDEAEPFTMPGYHGIFPRSAPRAKKGK